MSLSPTAPSRHTTTTVVRALDADVARMLLDDPRRFTETQGLGLAPGYLAFPEALAPIVEALESGAPPAWSSHLVIDSVGSTVVGLGGYKGPPWNGAVEIGYSVAPEHRGRGHATNAVRAWVRRAARAGVSTVIAHTLAEPNASTKVLQRCGFERSGVVADDGDIWAWRLRTVPGTPGVAR